MKSYPKKKKKKKKKTDLNHFCRCRWQWGRNQAMVRRKTSGSEGRAN